jgi:methylisocitrate lyase
VEEIRDFAAAVRVPLLANMTEFGKTPLLPADELARLGYKMVIWPVTALRVAARAMEETYAELARAGTQQALVARMQSRKELYDVIRYEEYEALDGTIAASIVPDAADPSAAPRAAPR